MRRRREHRLDRRLARRRAGLGSDAGERRHGVDPLREFLQMHLDAGIVAADGDQPTEPVLVIDGAGHPDRLVCRAEVGIAAGLDRDVAAQAAQQCQVLALRRLAEPPPDMQLVEPVRGAPAALDDQRRLAQVLYQVIELGRDVAGVEIHQNGLHLPHVRRSGLAALRDGAGHHVDRRPLPGCPASEGDGLLQHRAVGLDPDIVRATIDALPLVDEPAQRHPAVAVAEYQIEKDRDLLGVWFGAEGVGLHWRVVEVAPGIEVDDVVVAHAGRLQQRCAQGQKRHS